MSYYTEQDRHMRNKIKIALELTNHDTKKDLEY